MGLNPLLPTDHLTHIIIGLTLDDFEEMTLIQYSDGGEKLLTKINHFLIFFAPLFFPFLAVCSVFHLPSACLTVSIDLAAPNFDM